MPCTNFSLSENCSSAFHAFRQLPTCSPKSSKQSSVLLALPVQLAHLSRKDKEPFTQRSLAGPRNRPGRHRQPWTDLGLMLFGPSKTSMLHYLNGWGCVQFDNCKCKASSVQQCQSSTEPGTLHPSSRIAVWVLMCMALSLGLHTYMPFPYICICKQMQWHTCATIHTYMLL